jgi:hypothetical protein
MLCPKCGYNSFDSNTVCPKCHKDLSNVKRELQLNMPNPQAVNFFNILGSEDSGKTEGQRPKLDTSYGSNNP